MPDFTIQYKRCCKSLEYWNIEIPSSDGSEKYSVTWRINFDSGGHDYFCNCKSFLFRKKCKHIDIAKKSHCKWDEEESCEKAVLKDDNNYYCPSCGNETIVVKYAV